MSNDLHAEKLESLNVKGTVLLRRLKFLALLQVPLIVVSIITLSYVAIRVRSLTAQINLLNTQIEQKNETIKFLDAQIKSKTEHLNQLVQRSATNNPEAPNIVPISSQVIVKAEAIDTGREYRPDYPIYEFSLWLQAPNDVLNKIANVRYEFHSPSFQAPIKVVSDPKNGFRVGYEGYGCLDTVQVKIEPKAATEKGGEINFPMCAALGW